MQWLTKKKFIPKNGDQRIISTFLFFPLTIEETTKWLCFVKIKQEYFSFPFGVIKDHNNILGASKCTNSNKWKNVSWIEEKI